MKFDQHPSGRGWDVGRRVPINPRLCQSGADGRGCGECCRGDPGVSGGASRTRHVARREDPRSRSHGLLPADRPPSGAFPEWWTTRPERAYVSQIAVLGTVRDVASRYPDDVQRWFVGQPIGRERAGQRPSLPRSQMDASSERTDRVAGGKMSHAGSLSRLHWPTQPEKAARGTVLQNQAAPSATVRASPESADIL